MRTKMRFLMSLVLALCLLSGSLALAQEAPSASAVLEAGKSLRYTTTISLDEPQLLSLLTGQMPQGDLQNDPAIGPVVNLAKMLKDLVITGILHQEGGSFSLGSSKGEVLTGEVDIQKDGSNGILINLLPGYALAFPPDIIRQIQAEAARQTPFTEKELKQMQLRYAEVIVQAFEGQVMADEAKETGEFVMADAGIFTTKRDFVFTSKDLGALLRAALETFKTDARAQELMMTFVAFGQTMNALSEDGSSLSEADTMPSADDVIASFEREVASLETMDEVEAFHISLFEREDSQQSYMKLSTMEVVDPLVYAVFQTKSTAPEAASLKADMVITGAEAGDQTVVNIAYDIMPAIGDARLHTRLTADIQTAPVTLGLILEGDSTTADKFEARQSLSLSFNHGKPLITLNTKLTEEDKPQKMDKLASQKTLLLDESFLQDESQQKGLVKSMFMGMPDFLMRLKTAFPEAYEYMAELVAEAAME